MSGASSGSIPIITPRTPNSAALLHEEERKMMMKGKELLASDRLSLLAGRESRTMEGEKRTSEALDWLDKRLQADLQKTKSLVGSTPESPAVAVFREETAHVLPTKSKAEILRERIERRGMPDTEQSMKSEFAESGISYLSQEAKARISSIKEGRGHPVWHQGSAMPAQQRDIELWADQNHRQRASLVHVKPFPDLSATSKAARASAAPFIAGIYDQIFVDGVEETCGEADVEPIRDRFQDCTLVLDEAWDTVDGAKDSVGGDFVGRRSHYERRLTQNLADALQVPLHRIKVNEMRPGPSWYRAQELIIELTLIPDAGGHPPSCKEMCTDLANQAKTAGSKLRSHMPAIRVEFPQDGDLPYHAAQKQDGMVFSFLRGGIVEEKQAKTPRPDTSLIARDFVTNSSQHVQYMVQQVIPAAHRNEDGFWLKVDESKAPTLPKGMYNARYGTMEDDTPGSPRLSRQWRVWAAGAAVMLILVGWVLYMHVDSLGWH